MNHSIDTRIVEQDNGTRRKGKTKEKTNQKQKEELFVWWTIEYIKIYQNMSKYIKHIFLLSSTRYHGKPTCDFIINNLSLSLYLIELS